MLLVFVLFTYVQQLLAIQDIQAALESEADLEARAVREGQGHFLAALDETLHEDIEAGRVTRSERLGSIRVRFSDQVLFDSGQFELRPSGKEMLDRFAAVIRTAQSDLLTAIQIEGHTDDVAFPSYKHGMFPSNNWELSSARATRVSLYLMNGPSKLPPGLFSANGYGSQRPVAENDNDEGRSRNRRVEVELRFGKETR